MNIRHTLTLIVVFILVTCLASVAGAQENPLTFTINQQTGQMTFTNNIAETVTLKAANGSQAIAGGATFSDWWAPLDFLNQQCSSNSPSVHTDSSGRKYYELRYSYEWQHSYGGDKITGSVTSWYYCDNAASASSGSSASAGTTTSATSSSDVPAAPDETSCYMYATKGVNVRTGPGTDYVKLGVLRGGWFTVSRFDTGEQMRWVVLDISDQGVSVVGFPITEAFIAVTNRVLLSAGCTS